MIWILVRVRIEIKDLRRVRIRLIWYQRQMISEINRISRSIWYWYRRDIDIDVIWYHRYDITDIEIWCTDMRSVDINARTKDRDQGSTLRSGIKATEWFWLQSGSGQSDVRYEIELIWYHRYDITDIEIEGTDTRSVDINARTKDRDQGSALRSGIKATKWFDFRPRADLKSQMYDMRSNGS